MSDPVSTPASNDDTDFLEIARKRAHQGRQQEEGVLLQRTIAMPADTNPAGDVFGGWIMAQMDLAAGNMAARVSQGRGATVAVEGMQFHRPLKVGDEVTLYATLTKVGRTSLRIHIDVWGRARMSDQSVKVTEAEFAFVALDEHGKPRPIPR